MCEFQVTAARTTQGGLMELGGHALGEKISG
jgi:hypothetical protein